MPNVTANGIQIEYEAFGGAGQQALLLVMGLGAQMIAWPDGFAQKLADSGFSVIRYDNRDTGLSTKFDSAGVPNVVEAMAAIQEGKQISAPYTLSDMAADGMGLLTALGIDKAHIVGASMGGMIVQVMAIEHPGRVLSITSIMSTTGAPGLPGSSAEAQAQLLTPAPSDRAGYIENTIKSAAVFGSAAHLRNDNARRDLAGRSFDRSFYPQGVARQMVAIGAYGSRRERLANVTCPALVIHGEIDALVNVAGGRDTAAAIPGADLLVFPEMGHDLPEAHWTEMVQAIAANAAKAG